MAAIIVFAALVALCVLGAVYGFDSRPIETKHHRANWS
jgi:hypothetical protein